MHNGIINRRSFSLSIIPIRKTCHRCCHWWKQQTCYTRFQLILRNSLMKFLAVTLVMYFGSQPRAELLPISYHSLRHTPLSTCLSGINAFNPLPAFIATCDHLYLTADSASMISEAVSFGSASVNILPNFHSKSKLNKFTQQLCKEGYVNCTNETMAIKTPKIQLQDLIKNRLMNQF